MKLEEIESAGMSGYKIAVWRNIDGKLKRVVVDWIPVKSLKPVTPTITDEQMKMYHPVNSICQTLRDMYWLAHEKGGCEDIKYRCRVAATMADKMMKKLFEYKADWIFEQPEQCHKTEYTMNEWNERVARLTGGKIWAGVVPKEVEEQADRALEEGSALTYDAQPEDEGLLALKDSILRERAEKEKEDGNNNDNSDS